MAKAKSVDANVTSSSNSDLRAMALGAAVDIFGKPQFATQATPSAIVGLADLFYKYVNGELPVTQPSDQVKLDAQDNTKGAEAPKFG